MKIFYVIIFIILFVFGINAEPIYRNDQTIVIIVDGLKELNEKVVIGVPGYIADMSKMEVCENVRGGVVLCGDPLIPETSQFKYYNELNEIIFSNFREHRKRKSTPAQLWQDCPKWDWSIMPVECRKPSYNCIPICGKYLGDDIDPGPWEFYPGITAAKPWGDWNGTPGFQKPVGIKAPKNFRGRVNLTPDIVIVDNVDEGFSTVGSWGTSSFIPGFYGSNYRWAATGSGTNQATWSFSVTAGQYDLSAQWSADSGRATNATYRVYNNGVEIGAQVFNQRVNGGQFNLFDTRYNVAGGTLTVELTDTANGGVIADAVKVVLVPK